MDLKEQYAKENNTEPHYLTQNIYEANKYIEWLEQRLEAGQHETIVIDHLRAEASEAYLNYIRCHKEQECLGYEAKIASGEFGRNELESHKKAQEWYGKHCAYSDAIRIINDIGLFSVNAIVNGTKWTSVEEEPLADITIERDGMSTTVTYDNYLVGVDMFFAVPLRNGEYSICRGYIEDDGSIQESFQSGDNEWWGYSLEDVTHYMQIFNPK